jgi:protein phosphatase PTC7
LTKAPPGGGEGLARDLPEHGYPFRYSLQPGDAVILYVRSILYTLTQTDGLSDNLPLTHLNLLASRINALLSHPTNAHLSPQDRANERARLLADVLLGYSRMAMTRTGHEKALDGSPGWKTPFEEEAARNGHRYLGGKVDE